MKKLLFIASVGLLFVCFLLVSCGESYSSIKVQEIGLEVMSKDLKVKMKFEDAKKACADLGDGWRLPTINELKKMYQYRDKIGGFKEEHYWSSKESGTEYALEYHFYHGVSFKQGSCSKECKLYVRAVRDLYPLNY